MPTPSLSLSRRRWLAAAVAGSLGPAFAQAPSLPMLKMLVGFPGGAGVDPIARLICEKLRGGLWTSTIVENRPGAGGRIAIDALKSSPADGSTLLFAPASVLTLFPHVFKKLSYQPFTDLVPVTQVFSYTMCLVVGPGCPARTLKEYVEWVQKDPRNGSFATPALGSVPHLFGWQASREMGLVLQPVGYKGAAPIWTDLLGGQIPAFFTPLGNDAVNNHRAGKVRVLAVGDAKRLKSLPDVPTFAESGYPAVVMDEWFAVFAPAKTPPALLAAQNAAVHAALRDPEVVAFLDKFSSGPQPTSSEVLAQRIRAEHARWEQIVKASGFVPEE